MHDDGELVLPAPCLVVLVGPVASGKSSWAARYFAPEQIVSSDVLRGVVGESAHDLSASADAFAVLDDIVARRLRRRLTTVIDSLGLERARRDAWRALAEAAGVPAVAVVFDTPPAECRRRNAARDSRVPADVVSSQLRRWPDVRDDIHAERWAEVVTPRPAAVVPAALAPRPRRPAAEPPAVAGLRVSGVGVGLHLSSFDWPGGASRFAEHLRRIALEAEQAGLESIWLMDHLRQIPQVGPAWADLPDPYGVLAWLAARTDRVRLGVLVSPAFLRPPALLAKAVATLDVLSAGRAVCGLGVGWYSAEYAAAGIEFPALGDRYRALEDSARALRAFWAKGSPSFSGELLSVPEALSYPRPLQPRVPLLIGGGGERRTLALVARHGDACNLFGEPETVARKVAALHRHCEVVGRDPSEITVSHLSTMLVGRTRAETAALVESLRPRRRSAERFAADVGAGTVDDHARRLERLAEAGVHTAIVRLADVALPGAVERLGELAARVGELVPGDDAQIRRHV
ncbi:LLM class flavin-dependent oxidoreductase [Desertimonas flava]|uniref:LLM class flavin-dependent oxidoreductase n=1 Tax=Desertimonas flava TaxID=2064846 RepID=UPI000E34D81F|nr:LLM class flavin-dependent oxidoreductase [Desertimonas flava]